MVVQGILSVICVTAWSWWYASDCSLQPDTALQNVIIQKSLVLFSIVRYSNQDTMLKVTTLDALEKVMHSA